ncbi:MAG: hypothetical protein H0V91_02940 [Flavisolibacter sp.]|jgi:hypothetical protein|nr:hypothetical protein [Flavisolibacter sp.]
MIDKDTLLKYFYNKNTTVTSEDIFKEFDVFELRPHIDNFIWNEWIYEFDDLNSWKITDKGKREVEQRLKSKPTHNAANENSVSDQEPHVSDFKYSFTSKKSSSPSATVIIRALVLAIIAAIAGGYITWLLINL